MYSESEGFQTIYKSYSSSWTEQIYISFRIFRLLYTKEKGVYFGPPKTGRPRAVCLAPDTIDVLKKWKTEQLRTKIRHADIWQNTGFIFTKDDVQRPQ